MLLASALAICAAGCQRQPTDGNATATSAGQPSSEAGKGVDQSHAGQALPGASIYNADDDQATLANAAGKPMLVNLWASWCAPCVKELPTLDKLSGRPGAPKVIAVSEDIGDRPSVEAFLKDHGITNLEIWRDPKMSLSGALGVEVMPTTVYYDASGHEIWRYTGDLDWTSAEAAKLIAENAKG